MHYIAIMLLLAAGAAAQNADDPFRPIDKAKYARAVAKGRAEAEAHLKAGDAKIRTGGMLMDHYFEPVDRETGLYYVSTGCLIGDEILGRMKGHNDRIAEYIRDHGPPKNSFKPWEKELFGLEDYFEGRCRKEKPTRLAVGGKPVSSPNGEFKVRLVSRPDSKDGRPTKSTWFVVGDKDIESRRESLWMKDAEILWGPERSWFAIVRGKSRTGNRTDYMALDLRRVRTIRLEHGD